MFAKFMRGLRSKTVIISENDNSVTPDKQKEKNGGMLGQRHLVAFMGFLFCAITNMHRLTMGVAIVAMVTHTQPAQKHNNSLEYCPIPWVNASFTEQASILQGDFDWNSELQGLVLGASFLGYALFLIPGGSFAQRWGAKQVLLAGNTLSGIFTIITPFAAHWNVHAAIAVQLLRGIAQGPMYPALFIMMANWFPRKERGFLSTLALCGFPVGAVVGGSLTGWICDLPALGWPWAFYIGGIFSVGCSIIFALVHHDIPRDHPQITERELKYITDDQEVEVSEKRPPVPWKKIFTSVPAYALFVGLFGNYWGDSYFLSVHPTYMGSILHFKMTENGALSSLPILMKSVGGIISSLATKWVDKHNYIGVDKLRKLCNSIGALGFSLCLLGIFAAGCDTVVNVVCFSLSLFCLGISFSGSMIVAGDMSPTFAGTLTGIGCGIASISSVILPIVVGNMTQQETPAEWYNVFILSSIIVFFCGLVFCIFGSANVQPWNFPEDDKSTKNVVSDSKEIQATVPSYIVVVNDS